MEGSATSTILREFGERKDLPAAVPFFLQCLVAVVAGRVTLGSASHQSRLRLPTVLALFANPPGDVEKVRHGRNRPKRRERGVNG